MLAVIETFEQAFSKLTHGRKLFFLQHYSIFVVLGAFAQQLADVHVLVEGRGDLALVSQNVAESWR